MTQFYLAFTHPLLIGINLFLLLYFCLKNRQVITKALQEIHWSYYAGLSVITAVIILLYSFFIPPKHYMYTDEFVYEQAAKNVLTQGHFGTLLKGQGWAFLISLGYLLTGVNNYASIYLSELLGSSTIFVFFLLAVWIGADLYGALLSTLIFAFLPARLFWSATGESHTAALFFIVLAMAFSFLFYRKPERMLFWLSLMTWSFAIQIRGETIFLFGLFFLGMKLFLPGNERRKISCLDGLLVCGCLVIPQLILGVGHYLTQLLIEEHRQGIGALNIFIFHNLIKYGPKFLLGDAHPFVLSLMAVVGIIKLSLQNKRMSLFLFIWLFILTIVYFSMWIDIYGQETSFFPKLRLFLFFYPPLLLYFSFSLGKTALLPLINKIAIGGVACIIIILWLGCSYQEYFKQNTMEAQMKVIDYAQYSISKANIVVTCQPVVLTATSSINAVSAEDFLNDPVLRRNIFTYAKQTKGKVLFLETMGNIITDCRNIWPIIREKSQAFPIKEFSCGSATFSIDQLSPF